MNVQSILKMTRSSGRVIIIMTLVGFMAQWSVLPAAAATQIDIVGPAGSVRFGAAVTALPNGNIVVTDPNYDGGIGVNAGAVYLYDGATGALISTLTGSAANHQVGNGRVIVLTNGNYVVCSPNWDNGAVVDAGAVTWGNAITGISGAVSPANSLVGSTAGDLVGQSVTPLLRNGNYVVVSQNWDNGVFLNAGAATWGSGTTGISGPVSAANSLVGSTANDQVGSSVALYNGNYVVRSTLWNNGAVMNAGAVTWGDGSSGVNGSISIANSLIGSTANDQVGVSVIPLRNGNYVVGSPGWDNGAFVNAGAATWGSGTTGISGPVSIANSLVGSKASDQVAQGLMLLDNGNYVVCSPNWDNGAIVNAGAATWGSGTTGITGPVSVANSLVGSTANDNVCQFAMALRNGNYVVISSLWDDGVITNAGAATWGNGSSGLSGPVSAANSLVGVTAADQVGATGVTPLSNGNFVVYSPVWDNGAVADAGAATWGNGTSGISGPVSTANSLVGSTAGDQVGSGSGIALTNGNYLVLSPSWDNGVIANAGAATWGNGSSGLNGSVSTTNSLVGSTAGDQVGGGGIPLSNGNYLVLSPFWDNGAIVNAGAAIWGDGASGISGPVSTANSLVGDTANDRVGYGGARPYGFGGFAIFSPVWDDGATVDAGAITWGMGSSAIVGSIDGDNSVIGAAAGGGPSLWFSYDYANQQLVVGRPADNIVTLYRLPYLFLPTVFKKP